MNATNDNTSTHSATAFGTAYADNLRKFARPDTFPTAGICDTLDVDITVGSNPDAVSVSISRAVDREGDTFDADYAVVLSNGRDSLTLDTHSLTQLIAALTATRATIEADRRIWGERSNA